MTKDKRPAPEGPTIRTDFEAWKKLRKPRPRRYFSTESERARTARLLDNPIKDWA